MIRIEDDPIAFVFILVAMAMAAATCIPSRKAAISGKAEGRVARLWRFTREREGQGGKRGTLAPGISATRAPGLVRRRWPRKAVNGSGHERTSAGWDWSGEAPSGEGETRTTPASRHPRPHHGPRCGPFLQVNCLVRQGHGGMRRPCAPADDDFSSSAGRSMHCLAVARNGVGPLDQACLVLAASVPGLVQISAFRSRDALG